MFSLKVKVKSICGGGLHITSSAECKEDKIECTWRGSHGWLQLITGEMKLHACMPGPAQLWVAGGGIVEIQQRASQHGRCNSNGTSSLKQIKKIKTDLISNFFAVQYENLHEVLESNLNLTGSLQLTKSFRNFPVNWSLGPFFPSHLTTANSWFHNKNALDDHRCGICHKWHLCKRFLGSGRTFKNQRKKSPSLWNMPNSGYSFTKKWSEFLFE